MTAAHTPGPWVHSTYGFQVLTGDSWNTICELKGGAEWEDGRGKYEPEYEWQNQEANARLIAAAPDLLEALRAVVAIADRKTDEFDKAHAAIAKAEGRPLPSHKETK